MNSIIDVKGMTCSHCEESVKTSVGKLDGVSRVKVNLDAGKVDITYDESKVTLANIGETIEDQGFDVVE